MSGACETGRGWRLIQRLVALGLSALMTISCGRGAGHGQRADVRKRVVTTFTIIADMARNVAGDAAVIESLTKPGAEIHEYEVTPRDIVRAQSADLILRNGLGLERWFERFYEHLDKVPSVVVSEGVHPLGISGPGSSGPPNPHAWMSVENAVIYVENIRAALTRLDPENAETYAANAGSYTSRLREAEAPLRARLGRIPERQRWLVTCEGAFSYLARELDLRELFLWPVNSERMGTPQQMKAVIDVVRSHHIPVVFSESTVSDKPARQIAKETGARYGGVLYVDSLTGPKGAAPTYLKLLETNAQTIASGFRP